MTENFNQDMREILKYLNGKNCRQVLHAARAMQTVQGRKPHRASARPPTRKR